MTRLEKVLIAIAVVSLGVIVGVAGWAAAIMRDIGR